MFLGSAIVLLISLVYLSPLSFISIYTIVTSGILAWKTIEGLNTDNFISKFWNPAILINLSGLLYLYIWATPLFYVCFWIFAHGWLGMQIVLFRMNLMESDDIIETYLYISPMILSWILRWHVTIRADRAKVSELGQGHFQVYPAMAITTLCFFIYLFVSMELLHRVQWRRKYQVIKDNSLEIFDVLIVFLYKWGLDLRYFVVSLCVIFYFLGTAVMSISMLWNWEIHTTYVVFVIFMTVINTVV
jgi:hypothetical protein